MALLSRRLGIILSRRNIGTNDRRIVLFCTDGTHDLRARGTQKFESKLAGSLEPLTLVEVTSVRGRTGEQVTGSTIRNPYARIHASVAKIAAAGVVAGAVESIVRGLHDEAALFRRIRESFALISASATNRSVLLGVAYALWNLLAATGYVPMSGRHGKSNPAGRLAQVLLRGDARVVRRIRCSVATARRCTDAALALVEHSAERSVPARRFFSYVMRPLR